MTAMIWVWLGAVVVFAIVEAMTVGLTSIWFALGALGGFVAALAGAQLLVQLGTFVVVTAVALAVTRPLVKKAVGRQKGEATNADRVLGETAKVTETIDNLSGTGAVYVDGKTWTARSAGEETIPRGALVRVERMEGVTLFVERCEIPEEEKEVK